MANPFHSEVPAEGEPPNGNTPDGYAADPQGLKIAVESHEAVGTVHPLSIEQPNSTEPSATWLQAAWHIVTAVVGAGVLGLPNAFSYLGFAGGSIMLLLAGGSALYTSYLLASLHEINGVRHNRYRDLGTAVMGKKYSNLFIAPFQCAVMIGLAITYTVTAGRSLKVIEEVGRDCSITPSPVEADGDDGTCDVNLTKYIFLFGIVQLFLSQLRSFHDLWWVSIIGAAMSLGYSLLAGFLAIAASQDPDFEPSYSTRGEGWALTRSAFNALGQVTFAYGGHSVLLEIQATLKTPPSVRDSMMKGVLLANGTSAFCYFFVALSGYAAYGNLVEDDVLASHPRPAKGWIAIANLMVWLHVLASYQVFSHPVFEAVETQVSKKWPSVAPLSMRLVMRSIYVLLITVVAASFPFFGEIVGLLGAVGFIPMTFLMPHVLWLIAKRDELGATKYINWTLIAVFSVIAVLSFIGSTASIAHKSSEFEYWS